MKYPPILYYGYKINIEEDDLRAACAIESNLKIRQDLFTVHQHLRPTTIEISKQKAIELQKLAQYDAEQWIQKRKNPREAILRAYWSKEKNVVAEMMVDGTPYYITIVHSSNLGSLQNLKKLVSNHRLGERIEINPVLKTTVQSMCVRDTAIH